MKKRINKAIIIIGVLATLASCGDDRFNVLPNSQDSPESVFVNEANYRPVLDGAYDYLKIGYSDDTGNMFVIGDALADNLILSPQGRNTNKNAYEWSFSSNDSSVTSFYTHQYRAISRANLVLDNLSRVPTSDFMKNIEAEARGLRAIAHFDLVRAYSKIPTQSADALNSLGIAYVTTFDPAMKPSRDNTVQETYNKILADLLFALDNINASNGVGRLDKTSVLGYLSKVYLYLGDYDNSIKYGEQCIALAPSVGTLANFPNIWKDASVDGVLLTVGNANNSNDNVNIGVGYNQDQSGIRSEYYVNYDLFTQYAANDVRKSAYIITANSGVTTNNPGTPYNHVTKYRERAGSTVKGIVNAKLLRTADIYLTVAEAHMKASTVNEAKALSLLNTLRSNRYTGYTAGSETGNALLQAILKERRLEMAFENDRFWTLKRLGQNVERSSFGSNVDGTGSDGPKPGEGILNISTSHRFVLPIPASAIRINPNLKQNPNY